MWKSGDQVVSGLSGEEAGALWSSVYLLYAVVQEPGYCTQQRKEVGYYIHLNKEAG